MQENINGINIGVFGFFFLSVKAKTADICTNIDYVGCFYWQNIALPEWASVVISVGISA